MRKNEELRCAIEEITYKEIAYTDVAAQIGISVKRLNQILSYTLSPYQEEMIWAAIDIVWAKYHRGETSPTEFYGPNSLGERSNPKKKYIDRTQKHLCISLPMQHQGRVFTGQMTDYYSGYSSQYRDYN